MCGIAGYAGVAARQSMIVSMVNTIKHRGPNQQGHKIFGSNAIGIARLSIVDIENGNQPMSTDDGRYWIVFNGEIYNHTDLAKNLKKSGIILTTRSDTEVVLKLYEKYGADCLKILRGMFAFCIFDKYEESFFLARDRLGIKPLYYWREQQKFIFGSEIKAILKANQIPIRLNKEALFSYLALRYVSGDKCLLDGIKKLPPGHFIKWNNSKTTIEKYWQPDLTQNKVIFPSCRQTRFNEIFDEAVELRKMGDVDFGAYLSGGLDSSAVVHSIMKTASKPIDTFTVGFGWGHDEFDVARETANFFGTKHHEIQFRENDFKELPEIIWHSDEPLGDPITLPTFILAREASKNVKFVLTGEGADEMLGGYFFHKVLMSAQLYNKFVGQILHENLVKPALKIAPIKLLNLFFNYPGQLPSTGKTRLLNLLDMSKSSTPNSILKTTIGLFDEKDSTTLLKDEHQSDFKRAYGQLWENSGNENDWATAVSNIQFEDWLPNNILLRQDKLSMGHGLEARVPFLDHHLVEFVNQIPVVGKTDIFTNKKMLRNYLRDNDLKSISQREKKAFYFPMEKYMSSKIVKDLINENLSAKRIQYRDIFHYDEVVNLCKRGENGDFLAAKQAFSLLTFELWCQKFLD